MKVSLGLGALSVERGCSWSVYRASSFPTLISSSHHQCSTHLIISPLCIHHSRSSRSREYPIIRHFFTLRHLQSRNQPWTRPE